MFVEHALRKDDAHRISLLSKFRPVVFLLGARLEAQGHLGDLGDLPIGPQHLCLLDLLGVMWAK